MILSKGREKGSLPGLSASNHGSGTARQTQSCKLRRFTICGAMSEDGRRSRCGWQMLKQRSGFAPRRVSRQTSTTEDEGQSTGARQFLPPRACRQWIGNGGDFLLPKSGTPFETRGNGPDKRRVGFGCSKSNGTTGRARLSGQIAISQIGKAIDFSSMIAGSIPVLFTKNAKFASTMVRKMA